ncbi:hypothetical protein PYW49_14670 [Enterobacter sp. 170198]|uniref:Uncharacterized protein n=1 Tax=Enterobacter chinensis TaxID=3030997 RepID=A0ABU5D4J8_9ENTR|nr:hypothetical protein [Enterobacter sp. 170198]MDY0418895.1 hypothetical protein [Enterobacter sp. 170198]
MSTEIIYNYTIDGVNKEARLFVDVSYEKYEDEILSDIELNEGVNIGGLITAGVRGNNEKRNDIDLLRRKLFKDKGLHQVFYTAENEKNKSSGTINI